MRANVMAVATLLIALTVTASGAQRPPSTANDTAARTRLEAITLLQGSDSVPFLDTNRVRLVAGALRTIRERVPGLRDIDAGPDGSFLVAHLSDSATLQVLARSGARPPSRAARDTVDSQIQEMFWEAPLAQVGVPALDSLRRAFDVESTLLRYWVGTVNLVLHFRRPVNVPVVAEAFRRSSLVSYAGPELYGGDGSWIRLIPKGALLHFIFARGGGDCPAGCTEWDYYYVTYDTLAGSVALERQRLHTESWAEPIPYWDVPTRYTVDPYPTVDSLYAGLRTERWWYRGHAVNVLRMLLGGDTIPWPGAGGPSAAHFAALREAARARRHESYGALIERLGDADPDVARLAHTYLRELTGRPFPGGAAGIAQWQRWLGGSP